MRGSSIAIVGASDFTSHASPTRLLFLLNSLIGVSVMSLTLSYVMQVYTALQRRNVMAMNIHLLSACTGDAAELLARPGPQGQFLSSTTPCSSQLATCWLERCHDPPSGLRVDSRHLRAADALVDPAHHIAENALAVMQTLDRHLMRFQQSS
jgi:hypothetical protein